MSRARGVSFSGTKQPSAAAFSRDEEGPSSPCTARPGAQKQRSPGARRAQSWGLTPGPSAGLYADYSAGISCTPRKRAGAAPWLISATCMGLPLPQFVKPHSSQCSSLQTASQLFQKAGVVPW